MLGKRVATALALIAVLLPALFYSAPTPFFMITLAMIAAASWEWGRLNQAETGVSLLMGGLNALLCFALWRAGVLQKDLTTLWVAVTGVWTVLISWAIYHGSQAWSALPRWLRCLMGLSLLCCAWLAIASAKLVGVNLLLSILALVWVADIAAYFSGRAWGGRLIRVRLAPNISPGKTWEGVAGAMVAVLVLACAWWWFDAQRQLSHPHSVRSLYSVLAAEPVIALLGLLFLAFMSVAGDLFESLVKRSAGVKDSSSLLPGHGGVLDRVDALLPTVPAGMMLHSLLV